jgi:hypothetical protein
MFASRAQPRLARSVNASAVGHPCERSLTFDQLRVAAANADLQPIFALGNTLERQAIIDMNEALAGTNISLVQQQTPLPPNPYGIGGQLDWKVKLRAADGRPGVVFPCEFKSTSPHAYDGIDTFEDMRDHRNLWIRKWPAQLTVYMVLTNTEAGLFLLRNKVTGRYKQINVPLDYEYAEGLLKRAERVKAAVAAYNAANTDEEKVKCLPPRIAFEPSVCESCSHYNVCIPDPTTLPEANNRLWDVQLDALCRMREELRPKKDEFEEIDEQIKEHGKSLVASAKLGEKRTSITDGFFVTASKYETTSYPGIPDAVKLPFRKKGVAVRVDVKRIKSTDNPDSV